MNAGFRPDWPNLDLGEMPNHKFGARILRLLAALPRILRHGRALRDADVVIARNFDLLTLAWLSRSLSPGSSARLVYECLDIHGLFTGGGAVARVMRFLERRLLSRIDLLWTSSPGFVRCYFQPVQGYDGPCAILENKLWFDGPPPARPAIEDRIAGSAPFTLGWVGSIRCTATLDLLAETARMLGPRIRIVVRGSIHRHAVPDFDDVVARHDNITYGGAYEYPHGLAEVYLGCDAVWAQDLWQRGANSDWLLPNRIYEASWFGCPSIAVADTETGRRVASDDLGFVIAEPTAEALAQLLGDHDRAAFRAVSERILAMPDTAFRLDPADVAAALRPVLGGPDRSDSPSSSRARA